MDMTLQHQHFMPKKARRSETPSSTTDEHQQQYLSFLFVTPPILGKFLADKTKALGIPPGPLYGQLVCKRCDVCRPVVPFEEEHSK